MKILFKNGHLIDPSQGINEHREILVEGHQISALISPGQKISADQVVDCSGLFIAPGFVDLHVHFREPGQTHKEDTKTGSESAVAGGYTSVLCMANTYPVNDSVEVTQLIRQKAKEASLCKVYPVGAVTKSLASKELAPLSKLREAGCIAFSDDGRPVTNTQLLERALVEIRELDSLMIEHCEEEFLGQYVTIHEGEVSQEMGLSGLTPSVETADVARLISLAMQTKARVHLAHLSVRDSVTFMQFFRDRLHLTAEVTPHHLVLTHEDIRNLGTNGKMYPPLREKADCEALIDGLKSGAIDAVATDHAPHAQEEKSLAFAKAPNGVIGLETAFPVLMSLVHQGRLGIVDMVNVMSCKPAKIVGLPVGLRVGNAADMVVFSSDEFRDLSQETFRSKSQNTPFRSYPGRGRIHLTVVDGEIKFSSGRL